MCRWPSGCLAMIFKPSSRIFVLPTELYVPLAKPMDSTGGEIVLDQRRQPTARALFYRERRRHWGGKTSPCGTTEASRIAGNNNATKHSGNRNPAHFYAPNHSSKWVRVSFTVSSRGLQAWGWWFSGGPAPIFCEWMESANLGHWNLTDCDRATHWIKWNFGSN